MKKIKNIIILAGGDSDRFWPLKNKFLTSFLGKPILLRLIESISNYGEHIFIVGSEANNGMLKELVKSKVEVIVQDPRVDGMAGAVLSCKDKVKGEVVVLNASDFFDFSFLADFAKKIEETKVDYIFLAKKTTQYFPGAYVVFSDNKVKGFVEKPVPDKVPSGVLKLVADYFSDFQKLTKSIEKTTTNKDDLYEQGINTLLLSKPVIEYVLYEGPWYMLKYPWHVLSMMKHFFDGIKTNKLADSKDLTIAETAIIQGPVIMEKGVKVGHFAKITGPCYIGENTIIADYALVRESHIGRNCLIGSSCEVARSYLADRVSLHRNYVGDSVLAEGVLFGSGVVTANFRFDENEVQSVVKEKKVNTNMKKLGAIVGKNTKVGVNSTLYPGVKIGNNCLVFPGEIVRKDIPDKQ
ncbi:MAG: sugar phosphate nucleotidyltransferase [Patescibacteria group bacterium]